MARGFYVVTTEDRSGELAKFLKWLLKFNKYPVFVAVAEDRLDAHRKKTIVGALSPFESTVMLDTDMLINGDLTPLFEIAEQGKIGLLDEGLNYYSTKVYNSGVVAIRKDIAIELSKVWLPEYEQHIQNRMNRIHGAFDQFVLNRILGENKGRFAVHALDPAFNWILKFHTPEQESLDFEKIKVFHFLHDDDKKHPADRRAFASFRIFNEG